MGGLAASNLDARHRVGSRALAKRRFNRCGEERLTRVASVCDLGLDLRKADNLFVCPFALFLPLISQPSKYHGVLIVVKLNHHSVPVL